MSMPSRYEPDAVEDRLYAHWQEAGLFRPAEAGKPFTIVIPPPNVTGVLHMGHALNNTFQDVIIRYQRMRGRRTLWVPGTDHAGIATQNVVERQLKKAERKTRHDLGRQAFLERVWDWKEANGRTIVNQLKRLGASCDWDRECFTLDPDRSRAVRKVFVELYHQGLAYRGEYLVNWCPRCTTALSDEEAVHKEVDGQLTYIRYPLTDGSGHVTVATTRPETMLGDTGVGVSPKDERYAALVGKTVTLPFIGRELPIVADDYIDPAFGTGCLKLTPGHDPNDFEIGRRHGLPMVNIFSPDGRVNEHGGPYAGLDRFEARKQVLAGLQELGLLEKQEPHRHAVAHCQRCDTVLEPYLSTQWFVRMKPLAEPAIASVREGRTRFVPARWEKIYFDWMENIRDWCISRQLWWGHRIPAWYCPAGHVTVPSTADPDADPGCCAECGSGELAQDEDVLDTWFSSWLWPFSTLGWPADTQDLRDYYPTDVLATGPDIIFFWVARMIMAGLRFTGREPFHTVYIHGMVKDEQGRKMSKSLGNGIDPVEMIDKYSADALRYSLVLLTAEGQDCKLSTQKIEMGRNFANKLWNAARLVITNAVDGGTGAGDPELRKTLDSISALAGDDAEPEDRWILSRLSRTVTEVSDYFEAYNFHDAAHRLYDFIWHDFCDWYLELAKARFRPEADQTARAGALITAGRVLDASLRLLHPFAPFVTEEISAKLREAGLAAAEAGDGGQADTILYGPWPQADAGALDPELEERMALFMDVVRAVRRVRADFNVPDGAEPPLAISLESNEHPVEGFLRGMLGQVQSLARTAAPELGVGLERPGHAVSAVAGPCRLYLALEGSVDLEAERARLQKQIDKEQGLAANIQGKLDSPAFRDRAPEDVVARERERLAETQTRIRRLEETMQEIA